MVSFTNGSSGGSDVDTAIKGTAVGVRVVKALDTLTIAIRRIIDGGLKGIKGVMKINVNDTPVSSDSKIPESKN